MEEGELGVMQLCNEVYKIHAISKQLTGRNPQMPNLPISYQFPHVNHSNQKVNFGEASLWGDKKLRLKVLSKKGDKRRRMGIGGTPTITTYSPEELLGRSLNDIEERYAAKTFYASGPMKIPLPRPRVSIVGSRQSSPEGLRTARRIAETLTKRGVVIVSGLAKGIDAAAHRGAIESGGQTIAVLGTPLDRFYPHENAELQREIMKRHLAISQFPLGKPVMRSNFIIRNRTMAMIADATIIVEAGETSGSLSQGWETLRLGRMLFIWKSLFDSKLTWPKDMVRFGAMKLSETKDIFENLPSNRPVLEVIM